MHHLTELKVGDVFGFDEIPSKNNLPESTQMFGIISLIKGEKSFEAKVFMISGWNHVQFLEIVSWSGGSWSECGAWKIQDFGIIGY